MQATATIEITFFSSLPLTFVDNEYTVTYDATNWEEAEAFAFPTILNCLMNGELQNSVVKKVDVLDIKFLDETRDYRKTTDF